MLDAVRIVLVRPRRGGNVGAVARAMKNMGLRDLVLVAPRTRVGAVGARMAVHGRDVLEARRTAPDLAAALRDCRLVVGTAGREFDPRARVASARSLAPEIVAAAHAGPVALVFGPEDHGLSNTELDLCQRWLRIPTGGPYASLNLAQAVLVCAYELMLAAVAAPRAARQTTARAARHAQDAPATSADREAMLDHLARALAAIGFVSPQNPTHILRDVRSLFARSGLTRRDVQIWRGVARQILWAAGAAGTADRPRRAGRALREGEGGRAPRR